MPLFTPIPYLHGHGVGLTRSNYFIDSFPGPYHCSFPSIKHMPGWIMCSHSGGAPLRQKITRLHPCSVCLLDDSRRHFNFSQNHSSLALPLLGIFPWNTLCPPQTLSACSFCLFFSFCLAPRHMGPAGLQDWAQEPDCANGRSSCAEVRGASALRDGAVGERRSPPGTWEESAWLSTLQHDRKPSERWAGAE